MAKRVITFGEIMLRLAPEGYYRFVQANSFGATYGGGEANVAVSLANFGIDTAFVTKLPAHEIGQAAVNELRKFGVDTSRIVRGGNRIGIYFLEKGASQRPSKVIYDRAHSAIAEASPEDFDWNEIFQNADWFHFTGITPALNDTLAAICLDACKKAKELGLTVSCDLNYRNKLWSREKAGQVMSELCKYVDVCIANEEDAADAIGDTVLTAFTKLCTLREPKYFKTWLTRVLLCNCYSILRLRRGLAPLEELPETGESFDRDLALDVGETLSSLAENDRLVLTLYYLDDLPVKEIARMLGVKENTVKTRLLRGRERFKKVHCQKEGDPCEG